VSRTRDAQILTSAQGRGRPPILRDLDRRSPPVARILRDWRRLTTPADARRAGPGAPTLVACSGGADSSALVMALATAGVRVVVAHIVHDLRDAPLALADRDAAQNLAARFNLEFVESTATVRGAKGNAENLARRERYRALARLARDADVSFIATAHHADDQLESVLMALVRGAGPTGLAGVAPSRAIALDAAAPHPAWRGRIIRPMLGVTRADAEAICRAAGYEPRIDHTNADTSRLRNALRAHVTPALRSIRPSAPLKSAQAAALLADAAALIRAKARRVLKVATADDAGGITIPRRALAAIPESVLGETLRLASRRIAPAGADRRSSRSLGALARAVGDSDGSTRRFTFGGVLAVLNAQTLALSPAAASHATLPEPPRADRRRPRRTDLPR